MSTSEKKRADRANGAALETPEPTHILAPRPGTRQARNGFPFPSLRIIIEAGLATFLRIDRVREAA